MRDRMGREIDYLRVSVTDRCNLRCRYCMPGGVPSVEHAEVLRYEELLRLCGLAAGLGIHAFKVTGGEPLVRRDCMSFLAELKKLRGVEQVTLTTNGILLPDHLEALRTAGVDGINVSLDTLDDGLYSSLTGAPPGTAALVWRAAVASAAPCRALVRLLAAAARLRCPPLPFSRAKIQMHKFVFVLGTVCTKREKSVRRHIDRKARPIV